LQVGTIKVLIVEDDREINQLLTRYLQREGYRTASVYSGTEALAAVKASPCHLVILDLMLPEVDGFEVLRRIREQGNTPVLILSARDQEVDKLLGLGLGADDYMTKPFSIRELVARVKAQLRRYLYLQEDAPEQETRLVYGDLELDLLTYELLVRGEAKSLTAKEFEIMKLFISNPSRVFTKAQIFRAVWQEDYLTDENTVMVHIRRLRTKIEEDPSQPVYLQTVWGIGYRLGGN
jgi:DNA-binding response OmpR family regulator